MNCQKIPIFYFTIDFCFTFALFSAEMAKLPKMVSRGLFSSFITEVDFNVIVGTIRYEMQSILLTYLATKHALNTENDGF